MKKKLIVKVYSSGWYLYLLLILLTLITFKIMLAEKSESQILHFLLIFNILEFIWLRIYKYCLRFVKDFNYKPLKELPCYLCNFATILSIYACITADQGCMAYVSSVGFSGALLAYLMPEPDFICVDFFSMKSFGFYGYHGLLMVSCLSFMVLGVHRPSLQYILPMIFIGTLCLIVAHISNYILKKGKCPEVNYAFTYGPGTNGVLAAMYKIIPVRFFYLLPFFLPFIGFYLIEVVLFLFIH